MKALLLALALTGLSFFAPAQGVKISEYPNTNTLANTNLFIIAIKGATNMNISWGQLRFLILSDGTNIATAYATDGTNYTISSTNWAAANVTNLIVEQAYFRTNNVGSQRTTNNIEYISGSHLANPEGTNITLQASKADSYIGTSNVNIVAVMGGIAGSALNKTIVITNGTGVTWGLSFSAVTNAWHWAYTQAAPTVMTNGTQLLIAMRVDGSNITAGYMYTPWP